MGRLDARIAASIEPSLEGLGYELVRVLVQGRERRTVQVMAERRDRRAMTVEDCAELSHAISAVLDVEDPVAGAYTLEVSSPGLDRPLTRPEDFERFAGHAARIETDLPLDGRRRFTGELGGRRGEDVLVRTAEAELAIPLARVKKAKLLLTDDLLKASGAGRGARE